MSVVTWPGQNRPYALLCFDADGAERPASGGIASEALLHASADPTDIFINIHGWMGDIPAAIDQYNRWFSSLLALHDVSVRLATLRPQGFVPMLVGLHWPSLPWGDEELPAAASFSPPEGREVDALVDAYAGRLGERAGLREALTIIIANALADSAPPTMPETVRAAYEVLDLMMTELTAGGPNAQPGADNPPFDASAIFEASISGPASFGLEMFGSLLVPLQTLSFWKMKDRARSIGEVSFHSLFRRLAGRYPMARLHVMGHSFGCIAASAAVAGRPGEQGNQIASLALIQGALSLWSYGSNNHYGSGRGYFERLVGDQLVNGPIIATQSRHDRALSYFYPLGAAARWQIDFDAGQLPRFGALGIYGAQGLGAPVRNIAILDAGAAYDFAGRAVHNIEASRAICRGGGVSGAHSDIDGPEVAHLIWSAAVAAG